MKEKRLKIIIALMAFALVGSIAVQLLWVVNLIELEEARFESDVVDAMNIVVDKIDKLETADVLIKQVSKGSNKPIAWVNKHKTTKRSIIVGDSLIENTEVEFMTTLEDSSMELNVQVLKDADSTNSNFVVFSYSNNSNGNKTKVLTKEDYDKFIINRKEVFDDVIEELVTIRNVVKIEDRVRKDQLDSLLNTEFKNNGITANYNFGILDKKDNKFIYLKEESEKDELTKTEFRSQLFPEDIFSDPNFLFVSFPNQREYVLKSMAATLSLSLLFIVLIIIVFYKTVQMLIKQKKITDIKNDLINNITHEFKTPLSTISLACEALNEPKLLADSSAVLKYSKIINDENSRIRNLIDNLLNSASLEKGEFEISKVSISLSEIINKSVQNFELQMNKRDGHFKLNLNADNDQIIADPFHLSIIINNIIDNAIKYNEGKPEIVISTENFNNKVTIEISDNGIGIKKSDMKNIFDSFYRVPTGNIQNVQGSGMGLHYVKILTEANNGSVTAESNFGKGTKIKVEFENE
jgi:two-component system phosphate regulon sensor histidine kinase PhoR